MPVYNKRGILLLPKVIVLNPKDGLHGLFQIQTMPVTAMIQVAVLAFIPTTIIQLRRKIINA